MNLLAMQQKYIIKHFMKITIDNFMEFYPLIDAKYLTQQER